MTTTHQFRYVIELHKEHNLEVYEINYLMNLSQFNVYKVLEMKNLAKKEHKEYIKQLDDLNAI